MAAEEFKVEFKKDVQFRDICYTYDNVITALADICQEDFRNGKDTVDRQLYPALDVTGKPSEDKGIKVASASKLSPGFNLSLSGDTTTNDQTIITGNKAITLETSLSKINGVNTDTIFDFSISGEAIPFKAKNVTDTICGCNILKKDDSTQYIFNKDSSGVAGLIALRSVESDNFYSEKTVTFKGDVTGELKTDFADSETGISAELKLGIKVVDVTINDRFSKTETEGDPNKWYCKKVGGVLLYNEYVLEVPGITADSNVIIIPNGTTLNDLEVIRMLNLANGETKENKVIIRSYGGYLPPEDKNPKLKLLIYGKVVA